MAKSRSSKKLNALLVFPESPDTYWSFKHALRLAGKRSAFPPLGLLTIASMLPAAWEKRLVDMNVRELRDSDIDWADIVMASAMTVQQHSLREVIDRCKKRNRPVAVGGPIVSRSSKLVDGADHLFIGAAETTLGGFISDLERGDAKHIYQSVLTPDPGSGPIPAFGLAELKHYSSNSLQYSRGCPFVCEFCDVIEIYGREARTKSNARMIAELQALYDTGARGPLFIVDDNFIGNKKNVKNMLPELCEWTERRGHPFQFFTDASMNLADDAELLRLMQRAGFRKVFIGIESPFEDSLKEAKKTQNTRRSLVDSVRRVQSYGIEVMAGLTVGFDHDPPDIFQRQIAFVRESAIPLAIVHLLTALPDTQLWRRLEKEGRLPGENVGSGSDAGLNFVTRMDRDTLVRGYRSILQTIYDPPEYYERAFASLDNTFKTDPPPARNRTLGKFVAFCRILIRLGALDPARKDFWRYFRRILTERRDLLADAMALAATGYHFRRITETYRAPAPPAFSKKGIPACQVLLR